MLTGVTSPGALLPERRPFLQGPAVRGAAGPVPHLRQPAGRPDALLGGEPGRAAHGRARHLHTGRHEDHQSRGHPGGPKLRVLQYGHVQEAGLPGKSGPDVEHAARTAVAGTHASAALGQRTG